MIQDLDKTLEKLVYEKGKLSRNDVDVSFDQPNSDWSSRISRPTVNCWCFDLQENVKLRTMQRRVTNEDTLGVISYPPIRIDLTYMITAWARKVEDEHALMWRVLSVMSQTPELIPANCEGALKDQPYNLPMLVANIPERIPNMSDLWSVLNNQMRMGFLAVITVSLDRTIAIETPLTFSSTVRIGQSENPADRTLQVADKEIVRQTERPGNGTPPGEDESKTSRKRK
jgi:hypothetical protein